MLVFNAVDCSFLGQFVLNQVNTYIRNAVVYDTFKKNTDH